MSLQTLQDRSRDGQTGYQLDYLVHPQSTVACIPDNAEPNNTQATAYERAYGYHRYTLCGATTEEVADDWFAMDVEMDQEITVLTARDSGGTVESGTFTLLDPAGTVVRTWPIDDIVRERTFSAQMSGRYFIHVQRTIDAQGDVMDGDTYTLWLTVNFPDTGGPA